MMSSRELKECRCRRNQYSGGHNDVLRRGPCTVSSHGRKVTRLISNFMLPGTISRILCNDYFMVLKMPEIDPSANASGSQGSRADG